MADAQAEPKLLLPQLKPLYDFAIPLAWPVIRIAAGWNLAVHGWGKVTRGPSAYLKGFSEQGLEPAIMWAWGALTIEFVGGIALILGLFTRFWAAAAAIEMAIIMCLYWNNGFAWLARGYEYVLLWGLVCFAIALRGGGPYSLDRKLGKEL
ncbi:MAG: putative oxidoreductase [Alphaproteobacteria bacterium]|nr:putative oxidoreductase [Alphaproteobacteria bacterium]